MFRCGGAKEHLFPEVGDQNIPFGADRIGTL
jgi:hypothetical protein